jgi:hypothetical protein
MRSTGGGYDGIAAAGASMRTARCAKSQPEAAMNFRIAALSLLVIPGLSACGLAETAATSGAAGASAAEQVKEGKRVEEKVKADIEATQKQAADARAAAEAAATGNAAE